MQGLSPAQARAIPLLSAAVGPLLAKRGQSSLPPAIAKVYNKKIIRPEGELNLRVYSPQSDSPLPILVYYHGGGFALGGIGDYDLSARALAAGAKCVVVSVGYRQAPEFRYPTALNDAYSAFRYVSSNAEEFQGDKQRIAIAGEGSGANLATSVCLMALNNRVAMPIHQLLICPLVDARIGRYPNGSRLYGVNNPGWSLKQYLRGPKDRNSPYLSPITKNSIDLPPATIIVAGLDPLRSQGKAYHDRLLNSAVDSRLGTYEGVTSDFFGAGQVLAQARKAQAFACQRLKKAFDTNRPNGRWNFPDTHSYSTSPVAEPRPSQNAAPPAEAKPAPERANRDTDRPTTETPTRRRSSKPRAR